MNESELKVSSNDPVVEKSKNKIPDILGGVVLISGGIILLLNNIGIIPWLIWTYIFPFWPVIFVFIGLDIISEKSPLLKLLTTSIGLGTVIFIICYALTATDYRIRNYLYKNFPVWKKIYQLIPKTKQSGGYYNSFKDFPNPRGYRENN